MTGIDEVRVLSLNCRWPGFGTTKLEALPWDTRCSALVKSVKNAKVDVVMAQELGDHARGGQAEELFDALGFKYHAHVLNAVGWNPKRFTEKDTRELTLDDHGQYPGRTAIAVKLLDADKNRFRAASTHLATHSKSPQVSDAKAVQYRSEQMHAVMSWINDDENDWPALLGMDSNSRGSDKSKTAPRGWATTYGWEWPSDLTGIDLVLANFGAVITTSKSIELGTASDHDGRFVIAHTTKR